MTLRRCTGAHRLRQLAEHRQAIVEIYALSGRQPLIESHCSGLVLENDRRAEVGVESFEGRDHVAVRDAVGHEKLTVGGPLE